MNDVSRVHKVQQLYIADFLHIIPGINDTAACGLVIEPLKLLDVDRKIGIIGSSGFNFHRIEFAVRRLQQIDLQPVGIPEEIESGILTCIVSGFQGFDDDHVLKEIPHQRIAGDHAGLGLV